MKSDPTDNRGYVLTGIPHAAAIQLTIVSIEDNIVTTLVPHDPRFIGDPETGVVHGGLVTTMLDNSCGVAVTAKSGRGGEIATLDLRIDYMKPAVAGKDILARCECYKVTRNIAFVRGAAYQDDPEDPIATCAAAFMLGAKSARGANLPPKDAA